MIKRILIISVISISSLLIMAISAVAIVLNFVFTPEKVTPIVNKVAKEYIKSDVSIGRVDLTFFSTFPNFSAQIDSLSIKQQNDSLPDFVAAKSCVVSFNPLAIFKNEIVINRILIDNGDIYLYADSLGSSLDIFKLEPSTESVDSLSSDYINYKITIRGVQIDSSVVVIDDRLKEFYTKLDGFSIDFSGDLSDKIVDFNLNLDWKNLLVWRQNELLLNNIALTLNSKMRFDKDFLSLKFENTDVTLNKIALKTSGVLRGDSIKKSLNVDINSSLTTPSLVEFLNLIPKSLVDTKDKIETGGSVNLELNVKGEYSDSLMPMVSAKLLIDGAKARYSSKKVSINSVDCDAFMFLDLNNPKKSFLDINRFSVNSTQILDLTLKGKVTSFLKNPFLNLEVISNIDFNRLTEIFPLQDGVNFKGENRTKVHARFALNDILKSNYGKLYLDGESVFENLIFSLDAKKLTKDSLGAFMYVEMNEGTFLFGNSVKDSDSKNSSTLQTSINFSGLGFKDEKGEFVLIRNLKLSAGAKFDKVTKESYGLGAELDMQNISLGVDKQLDINLQRSTVQFVVVPESDGVKARIEASIKSDSISAREVKNSSDLTLSLVGAKLVLTKEMAKKWNIGGVVGFSNFKMYSDLFPLVIDVPGTSVTFNDNVLNLNNARIKIGDSDIVATGRVDNLFKSMFSNKESVIFGKLRISSQMLDVAQIIDATNKSVLFSSDTSMVALKTENVDSIGAMILVPDNVNFDFDLDIKKVKYYDLVVDNLIGNAKIKDGVLSLDKLSLEAIGASASSSIRYKNINSKKSHIFVELNLNDVDINRIGGLIPSVDSLMPMLKSFEGVVDFDFKAISDVDSDMSFSVPSLKAAISLKGQNLVLMDSETFKELSKMLMFKNKKTNVIDSLGVSVIADKSKVDVLPFEVTIDRYRAIIGGTQSIDTDNGFDINFNYNVSIIKSPLPFKAGVDIFGNLKDFDFKITKAKLKKTDFMLQHSSFEEFRATIK